MTAITLNSMNQKVDLDGASGRLVVQLGNLADVGALTAASGGLFVAPRPSRTTAKIRISPNSLGLERIARKTTRNRPLSAAVVEAAGASVNVWIGIPFAAVFVLGCLTLG
jgi:hypothetical protein